MRKTSKNPAPSSTAARRRMQSVRQRDTAPELALRSALHRMGLRYRVQLRPIPAVRRCADVVFPKVKIAVFVDGCFWHGCPVHGTWAKSNAAFWREKIETNRRRDSETDELLGQAGWTVVRVWEHENSDSAAARIASLVRSCFTDRGVTRQQAPTVDSYGTGY